jgi:hypothetical protein
MRGLARRRAAAARDSRDNTVAHYESDCGRDDAHCGTRPRVDGPTQAGDALCSGSAHAQGKPKKAMPPVHECCWYGFRELLGRDVSVARATHGFQAQAPLGNKHFDRRTPRPCGAAWQGGLRF